MKKLLTLAVAALMTVSLAGCGSSKAENKLVVGQDKMNGEFIEGFGNNSYDKSIRDLIHGYNPVIVDNDGNIKWETKVTLKGEPAVKNNKDGSKTFTVTLNDGLKWNDGKPVTANDYVMTYLMRASKSWIDANGNPTGYEIEGYDAFSAGKTETFSGVKMIDDHSFSITIAAKNLPYYWEKNFLWSYPLPAHVVAKDVKITSDDKGAKIAKKDQAAIADYVKNTFLKNPTVTCGPYKFEGFKNQQVQLTLNKEYAGNWEGKKPSIEKITVKAIDMDKDVDTLVAGEVDIVAGAIEAEKIDKVKAQGDKFTISSYPRNGYGNMPISCYYGATKDVNVIPSFAKKTALPKGIWEDLSLVDGDKDGKYQAKLKIRGGSIIPTGKIIQNTTENSLDPLMLLVCLDEQGKASGSMYWDAGDGWSYQKGDYSLQQFTAERNGNKVMVKLVGKTGKRELENKGMAIVKVITKQGIRLASGNLTEGIEVGL